jgi:hypothetical protein
LTEKPLFQLQIFLEVADVLSGFVGSEFFTQFLGMPVLQWEFAGRSADLDNQQYSRKARDHASNKPG